MLDPICDKNFSESFKNKLETVQYRAALVISGAFKGASGGRLYKKLSLEYLAQRRWSQNFFHNILSDLESSYLQSYLNNRTETFYQTKSSCQSKYKSIYTRTKTFK